MQNDDVALVLAF